MQAHLQPDWIFVRVKQPLDSGMQRAELRAGIILRLLERRLIVDQFSGSKNWLEQIHASKFFAEPSSARHVQRVHHDHSALRRRLGVEYDVAYKHAIDKKGPDLKDSRVVDLRSLLGQLDLVLPRLLGASHSR